jgi:hypothetical protein
MHQKADAAGQGAGHRDFRGVEQRDDIPAVVFGRARRERGIEVAGHGEDPADDVVRLQVVGFDHPAEQFVGGVEDGRSLVLGDGRGAADAHHARSANVGHAG